MACDIKLLFDDNGAGILDPEDAMAPRTGGVFEGLGDDVDGDPVPLGVLFIRMEEYAGDPCRGEAPREPIGDIPA